MIDDILRQPQVIRFTQDLNPDLSREGPVCVLSLPLPASQRWPDLLDQACSDAFLSKTKKSPTPSVLTVPLFHQILSSSLPLTVWSVDQKI